VNCVNPTKEALYSAKKIFYHQMKMKKPFCLSILYLLLGCLLITGCSYIEKMVAVLATVTPTFTPTSTPTVTPTPTQTPLPIFTATPSPSPIVPDTGWELLQPGLERRIINLFDDSGKHVEHLYTLRIDPSRYKFDVAYHQKPQTLEAWQAETNALIVINGGYFRQEKEVYIPNGLTIVKGKAIGDSYDTFAGMLAITDERPELRWLAQTPYDPNEPLRAALQSFPLLVKPGGELGFPAENEDNHQSRRSAIGQDKSGRILLMVAAQGYFTLHQFSVYLTHSDFDLDIAMNLDGGKSSGILLAKSTEKVSELILLPIVITISSR